MSHNFVLDLEVACWLPTSNICQHLTCQTFGELHTYFFQIKFWVKNSVNTDKIQFKISTMDISIIYMKLVCGNEDWRTGWPNHTGFIVQNMFFFRSTWQSTDFSDYLLISYCMQLWKVRGLTNRTTYANMGHRVLHMPVGAAIEWAIIRLFLWQACCMEMNDRIRNQVLVNRLAATSSKITKISRWEMLLNYRWNWGWLSWQISPLTFTCEHVQFEWLHLLYPANRSGIPSKFLSINEIFGHHRYANITLWDICFHVQLISKQITQPYICSGLGNLALQLSRAMLFQWGLANWKSLVRPLSAATSSLWRTLLDTGFILPDEFRNEMKMHKAQQK